MNTGYKTGGRRTSLTKKLAADITKLIVDGNSLRTAATACRVPSSTLYYWTYTGRQAADTLAAAQAQNPDTTAEDVLTETQRLYLEFLDGVENARARGEIELVHTVHEVIKGGQLLEEEAIIDHRGNLVRGDDEEILYRRRWAQPDGRLAMKMLAVTRPGDWAEKRQVEVSGPDGAPVQVNSTVQVVALAERVQQFRAERDDDRAILGDVVAGQIEDGPVGPEDTSA